MTEVSTDAARAQPELPVGRHEGRAAFTDLVRQVFACAAQAGWSEVLISDPDFLDWPLGERTVVDGLQAWARQGRRLRLLARDYSPLKEAHPRFVQWRTTWSHLIEAHAVPGASEGEVPSAIWTPDWTLERLDLTRSIVVATNDAERRTALKERLESCWHKGRPSFAATTLGL